MNDTIISGLWWVTFAHNEPPVFLGGCIVPAASPPETQQVIRTLGLIPETELGAELNVSVSSIPSEQVPYIDPNRIGVLILTLPECRALMRDVQSRVHAASLARLS